MIIRRNNMIGLWMFLFSAVHAQPITISGFTAASASQQQAIEQTFIAQLNAASIGNTIRELSAKPHNLGSAGSREVAQNILSKLQGFGFEARIETFQVLFPTPKTRVLEMISPSVYKAILREQAFPEDASSGQAGQLPTYNAWSADGDVTAELIFVNYGLPEDYDQLAKMGIDVRGRIVIAKYGRSWRGIKPKVAYEHGAVGCIIYSDPIDDGYTQGDVYPKGAFKNEFGVQRGSVMDMPVYPGDPLTPGVGATENAKRLDRREATTILKIPVLPISYHDAQPLLAALDGPVVPRGWAGSLPITYHVGPGKTTVHLKLVFDWNIVPCYDVIGMIRGSVFPDEWVIRGNHHDAWVNGADDPISGQAALLEEARSIGTLWKKGWRPKRTIVYCAWDGEEPALLGSTEWAEAHEEELKQKTVVYINSDDNGRGFLQMGGSHALTGLVNEVAGVVIDPQTKVSVLARLKAFNVVTAANTKSKKDMIAKNELDLEALGSGSDFSPFLQHLGVPSLDLAFSGENAGGDYHSIYDSYDDYRRFKDPGFQYGVALSSTAGLVVLRMAGADTLPFDFKYLYRAIDGYVKELVTALQDARENTAMENELINSGDYKLAADSAKIFIVPKQKEAVPYLDFSPLQNALAELVNAVDSLSAGYKSKINKGSNDAFNQKLFRAEQQLLLANGLPRRPWYKHALYAPGLYTGYGVKTLPGIREAIEQRQWKEVAEQANLAAAAISRLAVWLAE